MTRKPCSRFSQLRTCQLAACLMLGAVPVASGQGAGLNIQTEHDSSPSAHASVVVIESPSEEEIQSRIHLREVEKELRILRRQHFGSRNTEIRQIGIASLRTYSQPEYYPLLLEVFARDQADVRTGLLDMFHDARTDQGDATLAWVAVFDNDMAIRNEAAHRLGQRLAETGHANDRVLYVMLAGLEQTYEGPPERASNLARRFRLAELIPYLITAQAPAPRTESQRTGNLANIVIGRQIAFVSDLQPVVAPGAVGFDPTLSVVTEGVVLGIQDAVVTTVYRPVVHRNLVGLTTDLWGQPTQQFAYDTAAWERWYRTQFRPFWISRTLEENQPVSND